MIQILKIYKKDQKIKELLDMLQTYDKESSDMEESHDDNEYWKDQLWEEDKDEIMSMDIYCFVCIRNQFFCMLF